MLPIKLLPGKLNSPQEIDGVKVPYFRAIRF